jgi:hypothetical protein
MQVSHSVPTVCVLASNTATVHLVLERLHPKKVRRRRHPHHRQFVLPRPRQPASDFVTFAWLCRFPVCIVLHHFGISAVRQQQWTLFALTAFGTCGCFVFRLFVFRAPQDCKGGSATHHISTTASSFFTTPTLASSSCRSAASMLRVCFTSTLAFEFDRVDTNRSHSLGVSGTRVQPLGLSKAPNSIDK